MVMSILSATPWAILPIVLAELPRGYELRDNESGETVEVIPVPQNEEELDMVDRIVFLKNYITQKF